MGGITGQVEAASGRGIVSDSRAHLLIAGYFGCGNIGDDAILLGFLKGLERTRCQVTVMSGAPEETFRLYGVQVINRMDFGEINSAIQKCDALVFPGGSIFQDVTSVRSVGYYAKLVHAAKKAGKKVILLGQGIGPLTSFLGKRIALGAFNDCDAIAVRDAGSVATLKSLGVKTSPRLTADMAFLLSKPATDEDVRDFGVGDMRTIGIAPRPVGKMKGTDTVALFGELCRMLYKNNLMPVLIELDRKEDGPLINEIEKTQGGKVPGIRKLSTPMQLQQRLMRMESMISVRLHGGILAATVGMPAFMVSYDPKVSAFSQQMELPAAPSIQGLTPTRLFESFMTFYRDRERYQRSLMRKLEESQKLAEANISILMDRVNT